MKLIHKEIEKDGMGQVTLIAEDPEDLWHIFNLISRDDSVRSSTIRRVVSEGASGQLASSEKRRVTLTISVETLDFDPNVGQLRLGGRNIQENEHVKMGAYHTLLLELNRKFTLAKLCWDTVMLEVLEDACDPAKKADVAAVVLHEGLAHVCLLSGSMTLTRARIEMAIPRKRGAAAQGHEKAVHRFFEAILQAIIRHFDFSTVKCVLLGSPGFVKDAFYTYMTTEAVKRDLRTIMENKSKFLLCSASSGHKRAIKEMLEDQGVALRLKDTAAVEEVRVLQSFYDMLRTDPDRAYYGVDHVMRACDQGAVDTLLILDAMFRPNDIQKRRRFVELVETVRGSGGVARIFSSLHVSGEQLMQLSGIAAILRFPLPDLDDDDDDGSSDGDEVDFADQFGNLQAAA